MSPKVLPATLSDIPTFAKVSADSFVMDCHTQMKGLGKVPYDLEAMWKRSLPQLIASPKVVALKAVDEESGEVMGWVYWGFNGFEEEEIDVLRGGRLPAPDSTPTQAPTSPVEEDEQKEKDDTPPPPQSSATESQPLEDDPIARLEAMTGDDMSRWMTIFMPTGTKCMYIGSLSVSPKWQS